MLKTLQWFHNTFKVKTEVLTATKVMHDSAHPHLSHSHLSPAPLASPLLPQNSSHVPALGNFYICHSFLWCFPDSHTSFRAGSDGSLLQPTYLKQQFPILPPLPFLAHHFLISVLLSLFINLQSSSLTRMRTP